MPKRFSLLTLRLNASFYATSTRPQMNLTFNRFLAAPARDVQLALMVFAANWRALQMIASAPSNSFNPLPLRGTG